MGFFDQTSTYEDYKYVMASASNLFFGARYSFQELLENADVPFKIKAIVERYLMPDLALEDTLESVLYYMEAKGMVYQTLCQLKAGVKFLRRKKAAGKRDAGYETLTMRLEEFVKIPASQKQEEEYLIQELSIGKLAMMMFTL